MHMAGINPGNYESPAVPQPKVLKEEIPEAAQGNQYAFSPSAPGYSYDNSQQLNAAFSNPPTSSQMQNINQFSSVMVKFVEPLLRSPIVSDVAYETLVKLSQYTAPPLCNLALDIAITLRLIATLEVSVLLDLMPVIGDGESNDRPSLSLFERIIHGLSVSCKSGPLPVDSFTFVFPIMEHILLSPKKTGLHDDTLQILYMHMDTQLPLPRLRMLSALYRVLGVVHAYQASVGPALNELCLGLQPHEVASALNEVYAKDVHERMACLTAIKCVPAVSTHSVFHNVEVATLIWIALHDPKKVRHLANCYFPGCSPLYRSQLIFNLKSITSNLEAIVLRIFRLLDP